MKVGIIGATGAVGNEILRVMEHFKIPIKRIILFASHKSIYKNIFSEFYGLLSLYPFSFDLVKTLDICFLAVDNSFANEWAMKIANENVIVIDCSSFFRLNPTIPLVIPEINGNEIRNNKLIANPNCVSSIALMALYPLHKEFQLKRVIISTYQASSGAGKQGIDELVEGTKAFLNDEPIKNKVFQYPLPFNLIPHIDDFTENGYTKEEMKVVNEIRKILKTPDLLISCSSVRIPTIRSHSLSITIETEKEITAEKARNLLFFSQGIDVVDNPKTNQYPMPLSATNKYNVEVGRIRENVVFGEKGLDLFVCGDQLLRGAGLNAVLIMKHLFQI